MLVPPLFNSTTTNSKKIRGIVKKGGKGGQLHNPEKTGGQSMTLRIALDGFYESTLREVAIKKASSPSQIIKNHILQLAAEAKEKTTNENHNTEQRF
ncbi:hypothetical protein BCT38_04645 [Vibrio lentus]|nr:hypothetical protein BH583_13225 [Vibrio lentus]PMN11085.1 hypothetical protein BCT38_04645 [Vibrio lentus]